MFGQYGVRATPRPITWLKADRSGEFLSEFVLDMLKFDSRELTNPDRRIYWGGSSDYGFSNLAQFLNSGEEEWYCPSHRYDSPPGDNGADRVGDYLHHVGFLHEFEDYEIDCLAGDISLPTVDNIYGRHGTPRFPLFNRKGFRGRPSADLVQNMMEYVGGQSSFSSFWLEDSATDSKVQCVDRSGGLSSISAASWCGVRPKCKLKLDTLVEKLQDGSFRVVPFVATGQNGPKTCTDEEFMTLMGLSL